MAASAVGAGILISRVAGFVRASLFARYFGQTDASDAFTAALRIPNLLQNLFGEGALSGSFIPVHSALRARGEHEAAAQAARTFFAVLSIVIASLVLLGMLAAPWITPLLAPGFVGEKRELTIRLVRVLFPGAGLLVASAWCLGVLNSHGKFFLSYTAPVAWNAAMIGTLVAFGGGPDLDRLAMNLAWGSVLGSFLQFAVQAPFAWRLSRHTSGFAFTAPVRQIVANFTPITISRGAVQIAAYVDQMIASWLPDGVVTAISNAQLVYTLPVSLFGISISAAELPAMSGDAAHGASARTSAGDAAAYQPFRARMDAGLRRLAFFIVPSAIAFAAFGDVIAAALFQRGLFTAEDSRLVWAVLGGSSAGLLATTMARLYSVAHFALGDTKRPLRFAVARLIAGGALGYVCAIVLPPRLGIDPVWGAAGLTAAGSAAGWLEFSLLRWSLNGRVGPTGVPASYMTRLWLAGIVAAGAGWGARLALPPLDPILRAAAVLPVFGAGYFGIAALFGIPIPGLRRR